MALLTVWLLASCGNEQEGVAASNLVGTWQGGLGAPNQQPFKAEYVFQPDGTFILTVPNSSIPDGEQTIRGIYTLPQARRLRLEAQEIEGISSEELTNAPLGDRVLEYDLELSTERLVLRNKEAVADLRKASS